MLAEHGQTYYIPFKEALDYRFTTWISFSKTIPHRWVYSPSTVIIDSGSLLASVSHKHATMATERGGLHSSGLRRKAAFQKVNLKSKLEVRWVKQD